MRPRKGEDSWVRGREGRARNGFCRKRNRSRGRDIPRPTTDLSYTPTSPTATGVPPLFSPSECFFRGYFSPPNFEIFRFVDLPLLARGEGEGGGGGLSMLQEFSAREFSFKWSVKMEGKKKCWKLIFNYSLNCVHFKYF